MGDDLTVEGLEQANHKSANDPQAHGAYKPALRERVMEQSDQIPSLGHVKGRCRYMAVRNAGEIWRVNSEGRKQKPRAGRSHKIRMTQTVDLDSLMHTQVDGQKQKVGTYCLERG